MSIQSSVFLSRGGCRRICMTMVPLLDHGPQQTIALPVETPPNGNPNCDTCGDSHASHDEYTCSNCGQWYVQCQDCYAYCVPCCDRPTPGNTPRSGLYYSGGGEVEPEDQPAASGLAWARWWAIADVSSSPSVPALPSLWCHPSGRLFPEVGGQHAGQIKVTAQFSLKGEGALYLPNHEVVANEYFQFGLKHEKQIRAR